MGFKKSKNKNSKWKVSRSESYSDDYRITPDHLKNEPYHHFNECNGACDIYSCCEPNRDFCSQGCCSPVIDEYHRSMSPNRYIKGRKGDNNRRSRSSSTGRHAGIDVILVDEGVSEPKRTFSAENCSCSSCNSCSWNSYTKVKLRKNLFTPSSNSNYGVNDSNNPWQENFLVGRSRERSPTRKPNGSPVRESTLKYHERTNSVITDSSENKKERRRDSRGSSMNYRNNKGSRSGSASLKPQKYQSRDKSVSGSSNRSSLGGRQSSPKRTSGSPTRVPSPERRKPTSGNNKRSTSFSDANQNKDGRPSRRNDGTGNLDQETKDYTRNKNPTTGSGGSNQESGSKATSKKDLLNKMVSQTKEHRKQIRSLENELERLRSGDVLSKCEVAVNDVEWRPGDIVGEGSFSTVYKGAFCGTEVAVKELKFKLSQDDKNYFKSEAALLQQLHHPRVVLLMGICTGATRPFMLLEYLAGGTLHNYIHNTTRERIDHAAYFIIAKDVAQGMNYLHKHEPQVLHLDLKSMNVLLDNYSRAKIADFGFSILRRSRGNNVAQRGSIRGTPAWMAPELLTAGEVSPKCDVYSYAIILWEMLTAQHPFKGYDVFQIMQAVESGGRPPLVVAGVSQDLKELITSCWAQNPSLRPSFEEILGALETAAVPVSWKSVLHKASIAPSFLSDIETARTIFGMVEKSVELIQKSQKEEDEGRWPYIEDKESVIVKEKVRQITNMVNRNLSPTRSPGRKPVYQRGESKSPGRKPRRHESPIRGKNRIGPDQWENNYKNEVPRHINEDEEIYDRQREKLEQLIDQVVLNEARDRKERRYNRDKEQYLEKAGKARNKAERRSSSSRRDRAEFVQDVYHVKNKQKEDIYQYNKGKRNRYERTSSPSRRTRPNKQYSEKADERRLRESRRAVQDDYVINKERRRNHRDDRRLNDSRNSLGESPSTSIASLDEELDASEILIRETRRVRSGSDRSHGEQSPREMRRYKRSPSPVRRNSDQQRYSRSPQRRPRTQKRDSPRNERIDANRREPLRYGPLILTSEQLLDQKQRLRPVRPSALSDLNLLPQHSLNDISYLLKKAMVQRRDAFNEVLSGRDTLHSENLEWSDWH